MPSQSGRTPRVVALRAVIACAVLAWCPCALALNTALDANQYIHTAWKVRDGFTKGAIKTIAQTPDGYLWLGTDLGLVRFDGVKALPWQPPPGQHLPSSPVRRLIVSRDGTLWIATEQGLASWKDGRLEHYEALAGSIVDRILEDREGSIWVTRAVNNWTLCRLQKAHVTCYGEDGGAGAGALGLYEDAKGHLWVGTATGVWRWQPGPPTFYPLPRETNGIQGFSESDDGSLLISLTGGIRRLNDAHARMVHPFPSSMESVQGPTLLRDRDGGLWVGTATRGLVHVHEGMTDVFAQVDGLSGDAVSALFEDREGNIWVATGSGLDRFRESAAVPYSARQGVSSSRVTSVLASRDGSVWLGTFDGLSRWTNGQVRVYRQLGEERPGGVQSIFEDSQGRVWVSTVRGVGYLENDRFVIVNDLPGGVTRAIVEDRRHTLWIANHDAGLFRLIPRRRDVDHVAWAAINRNDVGSAIAPDPLDDGVWVGFSRGGVAHVVAGEVRTSYTAADGLAAGRVSGLYADSLGALWVAADAGLSRLKNGQATTLSRSNGLPCDAVGWVIEDAAHSLWLGMPCGLVRIARAEIDAWATASEKGGVEGTMRRRVPVTLFDHTDGVRTYVNARYYSAPVARSSDGKLWFISQDGASVIDPARLPVNTLPPPVHIEQIVADRRTYSVASETGNSLRLPPLVRDLQIDYTALSLVAPERMRFRYQLEGHDRDWQDVGARRQAFYNDLRPGDYRFRVTASNDSGVWNETGAVLRFTVAPAYYQTTWFAVVSVVSVVTLVWAAHRIRLGIVEKHEREITALNERLMKAQEQERIRIAGELHDGVMQEMLAVTMMLGTAKRRIPDGSEARATIDKIQEKMIRVGTDLRRVSHDLHPPALQKSGLPIALQAYCDEFAKSSGIPVTCEVDDDVRELSRGAALALFRIAQEALGNAAKHAAAGQITVRLTRSGDVVSLEVSDDGKGFDRAWLGNSGGLGLITMRERAGQLNGTFEVESAPGRGTTIRVTIPFR